MADEKFSVAKVQYKMGKIEERFEDFARTLDKINGYIETNVNASISSAVFGDLGGKLINIWNHNASTFQDFHDNFDTWSQVVAIIAANNSKFAVEAAATYRDNAGTLDGVKEAREFVSKNNGLDNIAKASGYGFLSSWAKDVIDNAYRAKTEKVKKNNTYGGETVLYTDAKGNKIQYLYDKEGYLVGRKVTDPDGNVIYYDATGKKVDKLPTAEEYEAEKQAILEELEKDNKNYKNHLDTLKYGTYEKQYYKASNGITVEYYIYKPDYGTDVDGLPVHVYLHGSGETGSGVNNQSLPRLINNKEVTPEGIVLSIQAKSGSDYYNGNYQDAVVELAKKISGDNNGDANKISLSGHSMGAIAGYKMIARHPDTFSAFVPVSGVPSNLDTLASSGTKVWFFHGSTDTGCNYNNTLSAYNKLKAQGADVDMYTFKGEGHIIQNKTYSGKYTNSAGETIDPLTWAMDQTRETNQA